MLESFIPTAKAQDIFGSNAVNSAANTATEGAETGIAGLVNYVAENIDNWIAGIVIVFIFYILGRMASASIKRTLLNKREDIQESALILVERITRITVVTIGITIAFTINGLNMTTVLGALSLGIGFALKDIIGNFISGVIMLSQNRVNIGDFIKIGDILGTIVNIDTRATILQAIDGTEVVIPNQTMIGETLISYTSNPFRRVELNVGVDYKTDLPMVTSLIKAIIDKDEDIVVKPEPLILVDEFGDSSIGIVIRFWIETGNNWLKIRSNLAYKIKKAFDEVGVNIPFPIRTLKLDEDDRSFLKTMDSFAKGIVPEHKPVPKNDVIARAAEGTKGVTKIPYNVFEDRDRDGKWTDQRDIQNGQPAPLSENTQMEMAQGQVKVPAEELSEPQIEEEEKPKAPPTHL